MPKIILFLTAAAVVYSTMAWEVAGCWSVLEANNNGTSTMGFDGSLSLKFLPDKQINFMHLQLILQNSSGTELYVFNVNASMDIHTTNVSLLDVMSGKYLLEVSWPPILIPGVWTNMRLLIPTSYMLQFVVIFDEYALSKKTSVHMSNHRYLASSVKLSHHQVSRIKMEMSADQSLTYGFNCEKDYYATSFASEFGISSNMPYWRSWTWILFALVVLQMTLIIILVIKFVAKINTWSGIISRLKLKPGGNEDSSDQRDASSAQTSRNTNTLQPTNFSLGVVSSRAPSPGQDIDENTFDYINKAYTNEFSEKN